jgi:hypothetical protein
VRPWSPYQARKIDSAHSLEEGGIVTRCEIITLDPEPMLDLPFEDEQRVVKVIMKARWLALVCASP